MTPLRALIDLALLRPVRASWPVRAALPCHVLVGGDCGACVGELRALFGAAWSVERFGLRLVSSPEEARVLIATGLLLGTTAEALDRTWRAMHGPRALVAVGDCAIDGGPFGETHASLSGLEGRIRLEAKVPGCPPMPEAVLEGIAGLFERDRP